MTMFRFPVRSVNDYPPVRNVNELVAEQRTLGHRAADGSQPRAGSWKFIIFPVDPVVDLGRVEHRLDDPALGSVSLHPDEPAATRMQAAYTAPNHHEEPKPPGRNGPHRGSSRLRDQPESRTLKSARSSIISLRRIRGAGRDCTRCSAIDDQVGWTSSLRAPAHQQPPTNWWAGAVLVPPYDWISLWVLATVVCLAVTRSHPPL